MKREKYTLYNSLFARQLVASAIKSLCCRFLVNYDLRLPLGFPLLPLEAEGGEYG